MSKKKSSPNAGDPGTAEKSPPVDEQQSLAPPDVVAEQDSKPVPDEDQGIPAIDEQTADQIAAEARARSRRSPGPGNLISWLALLLAICAIAALAIDYLRDKNRADDAANADSAMQTLRGELGTATSSVGSMQQRIADLSDRDATLQAAVEQLDNQLTSRMRQLESLPGRLSAVEASLSSLQGVSVDARAAWLLAEAEYYMQIANAQLQLARNPLLARLALGHADERLLQLSDPRLTPVRQALSDELRALDVIEKPDTAGITLTLASLAGIVESLPLKSDEVTRAGDEAGTADSELSGLDRAWAAVNNAFKRTVSVRRSDEAMQPLIAPEAEYFLRANLALQLQAARLAFLRGEEAVFRQSLDDADDWLSEYYQSDSAAVRRARETLRDVRGSALSVAMPDISQSLRLLRQVRDNAEDIATPPAVDTDTAGQNQ